ncbi:TATA element modulatory factor-like isoform X2 [Dreissena polymorpha]|uniref:TATA element modulatory factor 1 TATA binding domain-containing protein n=1 Tax=Dreissena polymorpha TaxID=45954 RepID=A0A9D4CZ48_DREPO|nr:TATA element modulatory factor-like isoform X2 [Dreissena polymorpha]KAH3734871.1 hypothetical protein DPMN_041321 [Dreissena polymorpha]
MSGNKTSTKWMLFILLDTVVWVNTEREQAMSWWNASNFTDLASKALKNAQKKIDKALDIDGSPESEDGKKKSEKTGGDFWSSWGTEGQSEEGKSAWSLPWGLGAEGGANTKEESLVKEKSAEEIKSEVLKAAKEKAKAKSKLFPKKDRDKKASEADDDSASVSGSEKGENAEGVEHSLGSDLAEIKCAEKEINIGTISKNVLERTDKESLISGDSKCVSVLLEGSAEKTVDVELSGITSIDASGFQEINEEEAEISSVFMEENIQPFRKESETLLPAGDITEASTQQLTKSQSTLYEKTLENFYKDTEDNETILNEPVPDAKKKENSGFKEFNETEALLNESLVSNVPTEVSDETVLENDKDTLGADISTSVEFVNKTDVSEESSASEPELLDADKALSSEVCADVETEILISDQTYHNTRIVRDDQVTESDLFDITNESYHENVEDVSVYSEGDKTNVKQDLFVKSESCPQFQTTESDPNVAKLDSSVETCTSEETLIDLSANLGYGDEKSSAMTSSISEDKPETVDKMECVELTKASTHLDKSIDDDNVEDMADVSVRSDNSTDSEKGSEKAELSPAHSFVKCMIDDGLDDGKLDDNSDSHSTEKSEGSRSIYSNHESGDEIDTTTSSDIEIISMPTPNGENRQVSPLDPIPFRIALQKTSWRGSPTHRRTDSSDSSNASKDSNELSPSRDCLEYPEYHQKTHVECTEGARLRSDLPALDEEDDNPYSSQRLLKDGENTSTSHDTDTATSQSHDLAQESCDPSSHLTFDPLPDLEKKLAEMAEVLQAREEKVLHLSKENMDLIESNSILACQLKQAEEAREAEMTDVNELTAEFTARLTDAEKRVTATIREKEAIKKQLQEAQAELARRAGDVSLKDTLAEKNEQIAGLLQEGEKLSKAQLQSNTIIKKLRQKEKDNESSITSQKTKLDTQEEELKHLRKVLDSKEEMEKKQTEAITQLTSAVNKQEQEMVRLKSEHEDATEKARGLQAALDNSYKEMAELHRTTVAQDSAAQEAALSAEMHVREELKIALEKQQQQHKWEIETLNLQIEDHRLSLARMEKEYNRREDLLKQEIGDLQQQLQQDEARTQELTQGVSLATRPLLRQIENLQSTYNAQSATWERVEKNLSERLADLQTQVAVASEKERSANEQLLEVGSRVTTLETQNSRLRQERSQLTAQLEMLKTKVELAEDNKEQEAAQVEMLKQQMSQELQEAKKHKVLLETQLDMEKAKVEQERKKIAMLQEQLKDLEREVQMSRSRVTPVRGTPSPVSVSRQDSMVSSIHGGLHEHFTAITQEELDRSYVLSSPNGNKQSLYETLRQNGAANLLENLQSQLKLREGEIQHLQSEIRGLERTRESMARELVDLSNKNDEFEEKLRDFPLLEQQYKELDERYNALLQMYGEKVEEADELKMDLQDVKDMYKAQINHLLSTT